MRARTTRLLVAATTTLGLGAWTAPSAAAQDLAGTWLLRFETPRGAQEMTVVLEATDEGYEGTATGRRGESPAKATLEDGAMTLTITRSFRDTVSVQQVLKGTFDEEAEELTVTGEMEFGGRGGRRGGGGGRGGSITFTMVKQG